jgi:hypothetical protein
MLRRLASRKKHLNEVDEDDDSFEAKCATFNVHFESMKQMERQLLTFGKEQFFTLILMRDDCYSDLYNDDVPEMSK